MWQSTSRVVDERSKRAGQVFFSKRSSKYKALSCLSFCVWSFPVTSQSGQIYLNLRTAIYSMGRAGDVKAQWKGSGSRNWIFCMNQFSLDDKHFITCQLRSMAGPLNSLHYARKLSWKSMTIELFFAHLQYVHVGFKMNISFSTAVPGCISSIKQCCIWFSFLCWTAFFMQALSHPILNVIAKNLETQSSVYAVAIIISQLHFF